MREEEEAEVALSGCSLLFPVLSRQVFQLLSAVKGTLYERWRRTQETTLFSLPSSLTLQSLSDLRGAHSGCAVHTNTEACVHTQTQLHSLALSLFSLVHTSHSLSRSLQSLSLFPSIALSLSRSLSLCAIFFSLIHTRVYLPTHRLRVSQCYTGSQNSLYAL